MADDDPHRSHSPEVSSARATTEAEAIESLVVAVPELRPVLDEHLDHHDELLAYVVFESDFLGWFVERVRRGEMEPANRFLAAVEPLMTTPVVPPADDRVWNLAAVCFVEALVMQGDDDVIAATRRRMGPGTWRAVAGMYAYRGAAPPEATAR